MRWLGPSRLGNALKVRPDVEMSGVGYSLGGGFHYFFSPVLALSTNLRWTLGEFSTVKVGNVSLDGFELDATTTRFNIGLSWYPGARR